MTIPLADAAGHPHAGVHFRIRRMVHDDLAFAASCAEEEGWGGTSIVDFEGLYRHDAGGCLVAEVEGTPVGICTAMPYGRSGFVGMLIVRRPYRGLGVGRALLECAIEYLRGRGATSVLLDGVTLAVPLYERLGFRRVCRSLRFSGTIIGSADPKVRPMRVEDLAAVCALDRDRFGADRSFFLVRRRELYPQVCRVHVGCNGVDGFIMGRTGGQRTAIGPWLATGGPSSARALLKGVAAEFEGLDVSTGVLAANPNAVALLRELGMAEREDSPWRMALGSGPLLGMSPDLYANGSPAKG